jgi:hypothetical protein
VMAITPKRFSVIAIAPKRFSVIAITAIQAIIGHAERVNPSMPPMEVYMRPTLLRILLLAF